MRRRIAAFSLSFLVFFSSFGIAGLGMVQQVSAVGCSDPAYWFGRAKWCGYFKNVLDTDGESVRPGGLPASVNTTQELVSLVRADLASGDIWRITAAQFFILTMLGRGPGLPKSVTAAQVADWEARVLTYGNVSQNGTTSVGSNGRIDWFVWQHMPCGARNTYYQDTFRDDVAPYENTSANSDCEIASAMDEFIIFRNTSGAEIYKMRRECMNPMGTLGALSNVPAPNFNLNPSIGTSINGSGGTVAQINDQVTFTYSVNNTGSTASSSVGCNTYSTNYSGYHAGGSPPPGGSPGGPNPGCPRVFAIGNTVVATETVTILAENQTLCRTLTVNPATFGGGLRTTNEVCVIVASKPYLKVFGGDISVGNGLEASGSCTNFANAGVMTWNKGTAGGYAGAGTQYAAYALRTITDFSTAQGNAGGAPVPAGLSFANTTTNVGLGNFGGNFGSVTCIPDFWARKPSAASGLPADVSAMITGAYEATGTTTLSGGNVNSGQKISVYIDGDVFIDSNIIYPGSWAASAIPLFELVVLGNIYIDRDVTQLDGIYIAQRDGGAGGKIYTCASGAAPPTLTNGAFYSGCTNRLTINGVFIANSVEFLRTRGTLSQSTTNENSAGSTAAEVFNFSPMLWMTQPLDTSGRVDNYDAILSLPPVL